MPVQLGGQFGRVLREITIRQESDEISLNCVDNFCSISQIEAGRTSSLLGWWTSVTSSNESASLDSHDACTCCTVSRSNNNADCT